MDGVLADVYAQFQKYEKAESGREIPRDDLLGKLELDAFPHGEKHIRSKGFFRGIRPIPGSIEGLQYMNKQFDIFVISSATEFPQSLQEKHEWLQEFYPFISWRQIIFCGDKKVIKGDVMIDDHPKNLNYFEGERIIFTQPHNMLISDHTYKRVDNWNELLDCLR